MGNLDWSQKEGVKPVKGRVRIIKTHNSWAWDDSRPCDKLLLAQVKRAKEEEEAIQLQGVTKQPSFKRIVDWGRLNVGEWERCLENRNIGLLNIKEKWS